MGTYTKNLKLETPSYTDNADIPALAKKNNEIIDSEMIKRANGLDYNEQTGVLQLTGNNSKVGSPIQIKNNLPVTSMASGTELKVNNYKQLIKFTKEGKTEQKQYTGKNFWKLYNTQTSNGITLTQNGDGSILLNGTATGDTFFRIILDETINEATTLSCDYKSGTISGASVYIRTRTSNNAIKYSIDVGPSTAHGIQLDRKTTENYYQEITVQKGAICSNVLLEVMLLKGNYTGDALPLFEPYVGGTQSPNPNYPQKIKNVRGIENLFKPTLATTVLNGITCAANRDGTYTLNGTATADTTFTIGTDKNLIIDKTYKFLGCPNGGSNTTYRMSWNFHNYEYGNGLISKKTSEARNVQITIFKGITASNLIFKPMFTEDTLSTYNDYVPYGSNYLSFKNVGKNLFNYTSVLITQIKSNLRTNNIYPNSNILLKKGTYILSFPDMVMKNNIKEFGVQLFDNNTQLATLTLSNNKKSAIFTINNDANINRLYTYLDNSDNNDATITYKNIQLEKGTVATDYEPYEEKNINVDLQGNELCSNLDKTTNDELIVESSKAKINKIIKEFTFTGDEEFTKRNDGDGSTTITFNLPIHEDIVELNTVSNMFSYEQSSTSGNEGIGVSIGNNKLVYIQIKRSRLSSLDVAGFKEFLKAKYNAGTPLKIQCELIEPEVIDLGKVDFDLIENSTLTCEEESDMQIDYLTISSNIFVQDSLDGSSSQKAPSIDAVNKAINKISNYSSEEQEIGEWFGEKHYRKVFKIDMDSTSKEMTIPTGIDMKQLTHAYGVALYNGAIYLPLNFYNNLGWDSFHLTGKGANIILQRGDNFSITKVFITLEYTKNV